MVKTACEREETEFILVAATVLLWFPSSINCMIVFRSRTAIFVRPCVAVVVVIAVVAGCKGWQLT